MLKLLLLPAAIYFLGIPASGFGYDEEGYGGEDPYDGGMDPYGGGVDPYGGMNPYGGGMPGYEYEEGMMGQGLPDDGDLPGATKLMRLVSQEEIEKFLDGEDGDSAVIGFFETPEHEEDAEVFKEVAKSLELKYRFAYTTDEEIIANNKFQGSAVVVYRPAKLISEKYGEKLKARFPGKILKKDSLTKFIEDKILPLVGLKKKGFETRYDEVVEPELSLFIEVDMQKNEKMFQYYANRLRKVAAEKAGKMIFNIADKNDFKEEMEWRYGINNLKSHVSAGVGIRHGKLFYGMDGDIEFSENSLRTFIQDFEDGKIVGKDAPIKPSETEEGLDDEIEGNSKVIKLTDSSFNEVIYGSPQNDAMIEFYAPWCGHCKALRPEYEKLADEYHIEGTTVVITAMDATANTVPKEFDVKGYPTIFFLPARSIGETPKPIPYEGPRTAAAMSNFIKKTSKTLKK